MTAQEVPVPAPVGRANMTKMRQSCQILRQIEHLKGTATTALLCELLPEIEPTTVQATISNMITQDRVQKAGKVPGTRGYFYRVNDEWEPGLARKKRKKAPGAGRPPPTGSEQRQGSPGNMKVIRYREQKIKLLLRLMKHTSNNDRDLVIGLLADLGHRYS